MKNKKKILLVEDEAAILRLTKFRLQKAGFEVITAPDGHSVFETVKTTIPDVILLDYALPDMDGSEVIKRLKADISHKGIPIIIFTASLENLNLVKQLGVSDGILKPYEPDDLIAKIKKLLD